MKPVQISLTLEKAEQLSNSLSDLLCIMRGIEIASPKKARQFMGVEAARDLNIMLKNAIETASENA